MSKHPITSFTGNYAFLSNFYPSIIYLGEHKCPTVEHVFQAAKTINPDEREAIRSASTPGIAKRLGRKATLRHDWDDYKVELMESLVFQKFREHKDLGEMLTSNEVRGLLCSQCNTLLGVANDSISVLESAILYLQNPTFRKKEYD